MDKAEFTKLAMAMKTFFPKEERLLPNAQAMELWFMQLADIPYDVAVVALNKWVATEKWSPSIAEFRRTVTDVTSETVIDWGEAWEQVCRKISRYGSYDEAKAMKELPPLAAKAAAQIGWRNLCFSENQAADRANFRMIYERLAERKKQDAQIPPALRDMIGKMQVGMIEKGDNDDIHRG